MIRKFQVSYIYFLKISHYVTVKPVKNNKNIAIKGHFIFTFFLYIIYINTLF